MAADFGGGGLQVVLAVVLPAGTRVDRTAVRVRRRPRNEAQRRRKNSSHAPNRMRGVKLRPPLVSVKEFPVESPDGPLGDEGGAFGCRSNANAQPCER